MSSKNNVSDFFSRSVQRVADKFSDDRTEYDPEIAQLLQMLSKTKQWCERIEEQLKTVVEPNIARRAQSSVSQLIPLDQMQQQDKSWAKSKDPATVLGKCLIDAGNALSEGISIPNQQYCLSLRSIGQLETQIGNRASEFTAFVVSETLAKMQKEVWTEIGKLSSLKHKLEDSRLDLDSAKRKLRSANTAVTIEAASTLLGEKQDLFSSAVQSFRETAKNKLPQVHHSLSVMMRDLTRAQHSYHRDCLAIMSHNMEEAPPCYTDVYLPSAPPPAPPTHEPGSGARGSARGDATEMNAFSI